MNTIKTVSEHLNVTPQAVYQYIKRAGSEFAPYMKKNDRGTTLITPEGEHILVLHFWGVVDEPESAPQDRTPPQDDLNVYLRSLIAQRDNEINRLITLNNTLAENNRAMTLMLAETTRIKAIPFKDILNAEPPRHESTLKRLINRISMMFS